MNPSRQKLLLALVAFFLAAGLIFAAPFKKQIEFRQPNGSVISLWGEGDEFYAVFETLDGYTVTYDESLSGYCYAAVSNAGDEFLSTGVLADASPPANLAKHLRLSGEAVRQQATPRRLRWEADMEIRERWDARKAVLSAAQDVPTGEVEFSPPSGPTVGQKTGLTLLVDFDDVPATVSQSEIDNFCNGDNYKGYSNNGSVKKYFMDNSNGKLVYSNVVTVYIRVPSPKTYYNDTTLDCGVQGRKLIVDAVAAMKALPNYETEILPTFNALSTDSKKRVLALNVFYAGGNGGRWSYGLWPHSWVLASTIDLSPGGKKLYFYQITDIGSRLDLGTFCHENGHMLCDYPDIYDYDYDSKGGAGYFCLMNTGSAAGSGLNPSQICAYLKRASGWGTTIDLTAASGLTATVSSTGANFNVFYRYAKPGTATEYFLAECRHKSYRDAGLPSSGIAIWHIDELGDRDNQSLTPNTVHANYEVTLVQADNRWDLQKDVNSGDATDLYFLGNSAGSYVNALSDSTSPNAHWWSGAASGLNWRNFSAASTNMTFVVGTNDTKPRIVSHPVGRTILAGQAVTLTATATGEAPLVYQWRKDGGTILGATRDTHAIGAAAVADSGVYSLLVTNSFGSATSSNAALTVIPTVPLGFALNSVMNWSVDAASPWYGQTNASHDGIAAARTFFQADGQTSVLQSSITGPCTLSFWWKVSSQAGADILSFRANGEVLAQRSGEGDWRQESFYLPAGNVQLAWAYAKDGSISAGQDCAWVDDVVVTAGATAPFFLSEPVNQTGLAGVPAMFEAAASGTPPLSYQWLFNGGPIEGAITNVYRIESAGMEDMGMYALAVISPHGGITSAPAALAIVPVAAAGNNLFGQSAVSALATNVVSIASGGWHSLALTRDQRVIAWGNNAQGQCAVPGGLRNVAAVAAGGYHNVALRMNGSVVAWGANDYLQCAPPSGLSNCVAVAAGDWHSLALRDSGTVVGWGDNTWGQRGVPSGLSNVVAIAAGSAHSVALRSNGTVVAWGSNMDPGGFYAGQSAVPAGLSNVVAIAAGDSHTLALRSDGTVIAWGGNRDGQLNVPQGLSAIAISAGGSHTLALRPNGSAAAWGANWDGQCGIPSSLTNVIALSAGRAHTLLLLGERASGPEILGMLRQPGIVGVLSRGAPGRLCALEYKDALSSLAWLPVRVIQGNGTPQLLLDAHAPGPQRFYRVKQW